MTYEIKKELGSGDNAVVFLVKKSSSREQFALKVMRENTEAIQKEIDIHKKAGKLGIAPPILEDFENVRESVTNPLKIGMRGPKRGILMPLIKTFVRATWKMVLNGIIHNDLHQGNVGIMANEAVIFDFGFAEQIPDEQIPSNLTIMRQLLISQLFSLLTTVGCNRNNKINLCGDQPIHNVIYYVKSHGKNDCEILSEILKGSKYHPCQPLTSKKDGGEEKAGEEEKAANYMQFVKKKFT